MHFPVTSVSVKLQKHHLRSKFDVKLKEYPNAKDEEPELMLLK